MQGLAGQPPGGLTESRPEHRELGSKVAGVAQMRSGRVAVFVLPALGSPGLRLSVQGWMRGDTVQGSVLGPRGRTVGWEDRQNWPRDLVPPHQLWDLGGWTYPHRILAAASEKRSNNGMSFTEVLKDPKSYSAYLIRKGVAHGSTQYVLAVIIIILGPMSRTFCQLKATH